MSGTLNFIADYSEAGYTGDEESGNFLVLIAEVPDVSGVTIQVTNEAPGLTRVSTLDDDGILITRVADKSSQTLTFVASKAGQPSFTKVITLTGLTCNES